jgi:hypothetical protein
MSLASAIPVVGDITGGAKIAKNVVKEVKNVVKGIDKTEDVTSVVKLENGFGSSRQLKKFMGSPGEGNQWHHIVEQSQIKKSNFPVQQVQNPGNLVSIDKVTHAKINGYYSSKPDFTGGLRYRDWLVGQSFETQYERGKQILALYGY